MTTDMEKIAIVGASSLLGKELAEVLGAAVPAALVLLDMEEVSGQVTVAGDEAAVIQQLDADSFEGVDFVYFTGDVAMTRSHWQAARRAGASIVDLTGALAGEQDVLVLAPWIEEALAGAGASRMVPDLNTPAVVAAHPAAVMLALAVARVGSRLRVTTLVTTILEPASEHGKAAMDELHEQTVKLLSFQSLPKEQYDAQIAFNLLPELGQGAKISATAARERLLDEYELLSAKRLPEVVVQWVHAPVFHGYTASVLVELAEPTTRAQVEAALAGPHLDVVAEGAEPPSNLSVAGQEAVLARVTAVGDEARGTRFWLWLAADNLKLAALNAVACGLQLRRLRPQGTVQ